VTRRFSLFLIAAAAVAQPRLIPLDEGGYRTLLDSHRGKVVLVNFWATWCAPCRAEMPQLVKLSESLREKGLVFVTVSADEPEQEQDAGRFLEKVRVPGPSYIKRAKDDDRFISAIDPKWSGALPATFLYDRQGRKARSFFGEVSMKELDAAVRKLL
jgi:thiol-disulfide isomerase/thioredoxin